MATSSRSPLGSLRMRLITGMVSVNAAIMLLFIGYLTVHQRHTLRLVQRTQVQDLSRNLAVAAVLAFVLSLKRGESPPAPRVDVPLAVRFDAEGNPEIIADAASTIT